MRKIASCQFLVLSLGLLIFLVLVVGVQAQDSAGLPVFASSEERIDNEVAGGEIALSATDSAEDIEASGSGLVAKITDRGSDLVEPEGEARGKLEKLLLGQELGPLNPGNFLRHSIVSAVTKGVPANTIVLVLLFPLVTAIIAASRHLIGLKGFGIFTPALVSVGFLATGIASGLLLFLVIMIVASLGRVIIKRMRLPYMPRTSLLLWLVSMAVLALILVSPHLNLQALAELSIFPILMLVLLAETFIDVQNKRSMGQAVEMTVETLILASVAYFVMKLEFVQGFVLLNPEVSVLLIAVLNLFLGKFGGLRLMEYWRFRRLLN